MQSSIFRALKLLAALLSVAALVFVEIGPKRQHSIFSDARFERVLFSDTQSQGVSSYKWLDAARSQWRCQHQPYDYINCGFSFGVRENPNIHVDFSDYSGLLFKVSVNSDTDYLRIFVRNYNWKYYVRGDWNSPVYASTLVNTEEFAKGSVYVAFDELTVSENWMTRYNAARADLRPFVDNIQAIGFETVQAGTTDVFIEDVLVVGDWVQREHLYYGLLIFWLAIALLESGGYLWKRLKMGSRKSRELTENNQRLALEKSMLIEKISRDSLTGILNRDGFDVRAKISFNDPNVEFEPSMLVFDIDHFKRINDTYGHSVGDVVLVELSKLIIGSMRKGDVFARWGGEEFVMLCTDVPVESLDRIANKLRTLIANHAFVEDNPFPVTVSIGAAQRKAGETLSSLFKRADAALYLAKVKGRNRVELEISNK